MEKNITPGKENIKLKFWQNFLISLSIFLLLSVFFGKKPEELPTITYKKSEIIKQIPRVLKPFNTKLLSGNFNTNGIRLDDLELKNYHETLNSSSNIKMFSHSEDKNKSSFIAFGFLGTNDRINYPTYITNWKLIEHSDNSIKLEWINKNKIKFIRHFLFDDKYMLTVEDKIINNSSEVISFYPYIRLVQFIDMKKITPRSHTGFIGFLNNNLIEYIYNKITTSKDLQFNSKDGWFGFVSDYFMSIIIPEPNKSNFTVRVLDITTPTKEKNTIRQFQTDYTGDEVVLNKSNSVSISSKIYIGSKKQEFIEQYAKDFTIQKFDLVIDYGYFYILAKPFTKILKWFYSLSGNFGIAIILFTILIRLLLFPIAQKSFRSMERIKKLQPEIQRLQALYAGNKQMLNMEIAMLYKKRGINPLSGCMPILLQIPVFYALYKSLVVSIEMRHAPFLLWIKDLSASDPSNILNLFGLLPFTPYNWLPTIGILPILMALSIYLQQKLRPIPTTDPVQTKVMKFLPFILMFVFAKFPSGLLLYWIVNNLLSIIQQKFIK